MSNGASRHLRDRSKPRDSIDRMPPMLRREAFITDQRTSCWCTRLPTSPGSGRPYRPRRLLHSRYQQSRPHEVSYGNNYLACRSQAARATGKRRQASNGQWFEWARTFPAWQIAQSPKVDVLFVAPGAGGNKDPAPNINIPDYTAVIATAQELAIDPVVIGPDSPGKQLGNQAGWD